jgi:hypothetical protein
VHRLQPSDRIFFVTANLRHALVPLAQVELRLVTEALAASRRKSPRHNNRGVATHQNRIADDGKAHDTTILSWLPAVSQLEPQGGEITKPRLKAHKR